MGHEDWLIQTDKNAQMAAMCVCVCVCVCDQEESGWLLPSRSCSMESTSSLALHSDWSISPWLSPISSSSSSSSLWLSSESESSTFSFFIDFPLAPDPSPLSLGGGGSSLCASSAESCAPSSSDLCPFLWSVSLSSLSTGIWCSIREQVWVLCCAHEYWVRE